MSCHYDVYCWDCEKGAGFNENHAEKECAVLVNNAKVIASMVPGFEALNEISYGMLTLGIRYENFRIDPRWFAEHADHKLVVRDEYGRIYDECYKRFTCCGRCDDDWHYCRRKKGHDGECSGKRDEP